MSDNSPDSTMELTTKTCGLPLNNCKTIVDFFKGMYDVLEAHRWAVTEHKFLHRDISHSNIIVEVQDAHNIEEFSDTKRPVFINEVLHSKPAPPMARLLDMDNCANLDASRVKSEEGKDNDEPLRTGTPKFIARSVAAGKILEDFSFMPMPKLPLEIAAAYEKIHRDDTSKLRKLSDAKGTSHGSYISFERVMLYQENRGLQVADFEHQPLHDAESVYWCIAAFVLLAKPLNNDVDERRKKLSEIWAVMAEHEVGNAADTRSALISGNNWAEWLHKDLSFINLLMTNLTHQIRPEWALLDPAPEPLHLHEAMQRVILEHVHIWETKGINVELDTLTSRKSPPAEKAPMAPASQHPIRSQVVTRSMPGKRGSNSIEGLTQPGSKRLRKTSNLSEAELIALQIAWIDQNSTPMVPKPLNSE